MIRVPIIRHAVETFVKEFEGPLYQELRKPLILIETQRRGSEVKGITSERKRRIGIETQRRRGSEIKGVIRAIRERKRRNGIEIKI